MNFVDLTFLLTCISLASFSPLTVIDSILEKDCLICGTYMTGLEGFQWLLTVESSLNSALVARSNCLMVMVQQNSAVLQDTIEGTSIQY